MHSPLPRQAQTVVSYLTDELGFHETSAEGFASLQKCRKLQNSPLLVGMR